MAITDPRKRKADQPVVGGAAPAGGAPLPAGVANFLTMQHPSAPKPAATGPKPALGTRLGNNLRAAGQVLPAVENVVNRGITAGANAITYPLRAAIGVGEDAHRALYGQAPRANAGQPSAGFSMPALQRPGTPAAVAASPAAAPAGAGQGGGTPTGAPAATALSHPSFAGVRGGNESSAPTSLVNQGVTVTGADGTPRKLSYGAMVDGVPTFSDGTGSTPRTVSDEQIADLGSRLNVAPAANLAMPLASDAAGRTLSTEDGVRLAASRLQRPGSSAPNAALQSMLARSEANAIASGDWRSASGTVAHNLGVDATSGTPRQRRIAEQQLAALQTGAQQRAQTAAEQAGANERTAASEAGANARTAATEAGATQRAALTRPVGQTVPLADGTLGILHPGGTVTAATGADGKPVKTAKTGADQQRTQAIIDQLNKGAQQQLAALTKQMLPGPDGTVAQVAPEQVQQIRAQQAQLMGLNPQVNPKTGELVGYINGQWMPL